MIILREVRDGGLPASNILAVVHPSLRLPLNALILTALTVILFGLIFIGSSRYVTRSSTGVSPDNVVHSTLLYPHRLLPWTSPMQCPSLSTVFEAGTVCLSEHGDSLVAWVGSSI